MVTIKLVVFVLSFIVTDETDVKGKSYEIGKYHLV